MTIDIFTSAESDEWSTPPDFVRPIAEAIGGFDLDSASGAEESPIAPNTYTESDNGLTRPWFGKVWCNPPYSDMPRWTQKAIDESHRDETETIIYLCKGDSSTDWWHAGAAEATAIAMIDGRLSFGDGGPAPFCSHVFVFGEASIPVLDVLEQYGMVFTTEHRHESTHQQKLGENI